MRAEQIARRLLAHGIRAESRVAVYMSRSVDLVAALLGVLKAGAAYVPLDRGFPLARLRYLAEDSSAACVLTEAGLAEQAAEIGPEVLVVDHEQAVEADVAVPRVHPRALCYIIYTSGSTGRPKGVLVEHRGLVNFVRWCVRRYVSAGSGGAPLFSSIAFDMIVPNLFAPLVAGQPISIVPDAVTPERLGAVLTESAPFGFIKLTPGHLALLARQLSSGQARSLARLLVVGADAFPRGVLANWRRLDPHTRMLNEYGPTEASVADTVHEVTEADPAGTGDVPIGLPIPNTTVHVLDEAMRPVPPGVIGEIYIGGVCVVRGYTNQPGTTAARFVPDPYGAPGARLYRSGDLGRWNEDGELDCLGRLDHQVKIRGYRVEPGEVEAALEREKHVARAVVTAVAGPAGQRVLAAYLVPCGTTRPPATDLRAALGATLPTHLVPTAITWLDSLPLNENGKLDRKALPPPVFEGSGGEPVPGDGVVRELAEIWSDVLGLPVAEIGADDDFFELGGDSMLVLTLLDRARSRLGRRVSFEAVLRTPTISGLTPLFAAEPGQAATMPRTPRAGGCLARMDNAVSWPGNAASLILVHPLGGTSYCYRGLVAELGTQRPVFGLTLAELARPGSDREPGTIKAVAAGYAEEIAARIDGPVIVAGWSAGAPVAFETARQLAALGRDPAELILIDPCAPDDASRWREHERELKGVRDRLSTVDDLSREREFGAVLHSNLFTGMGIDPDVHDAYDRFPRDVLAIWQRQCHRLAAYRPTRHDGDLALVISDEQGPAECWRQLVSGRTRQVRVGGAHLGILRPPHVATLADAVRGLCRTTRRA